MKDSPFETIVRFGEGYVLSRCLHVVAELGVADLLGEAPRSATVLAEVTGTDAGALNRVLRVLAARGIFHMSGGLYSHSPASQLLRTDHPQSMRAFVRMVGLPICWNSFFHLQHSVQTGLPAAELLADGGFWGYVRNSPEASRIFDEAMRGKAQAQIRCVLAAYDFSQFASVADIGGGQGHLLQAILATAPQARGVLFDQPAVLEQARTISSDWLSLQAGDFFRDALPSCDAYLLMEVIHDWNDNEAIQILTAVRTAAPERAKLLLTETTLPPDDSPHRGQILDIFMLALLTGRQRHRHEYSRLLSASGFQLEREIEASPETSIFEATRVA